MTRRLMLGLLAGTPLSALVPTCLPRTEASTGLGRFPGSVITAEIDHYPGTVFFRGFHCELQGTGVYRISAFVDDTLIETMTVLGTGERQHINTFWEAPVQRGKPSLIIEALQERECIFYSATIFSSRGSRLYAQRLEEVPHSLSQLATAKASDS